MLTNKVEDVSFKVSFPREPRINGKEEVTVRSSNYPVNLLDKQDTSFKYHYFDPPHSYSPRKITYYETVERPDSVKTSKIKTALKVVTGAFILVMLGTGLLSKDIQKHTGKIGEFAKRI